jgi:hypothetical protein
VLNGFRIPALSTRRTETEIELRNGQTFAIAGLMNNQMQSTMQKIPGIGDIPILGLLFRSKAAQREQTELVVMITPEILPADSPGVTTALPRTPERFMPPVSDRQAKPEQPPAFPSRPRSQADLIAPAAPVVDDRNAIERAQDQARQQLERDEAVRATNAEVAKQFESTQGAAAVQPVETPSVAAPLSESEQRAAAKQAKADARKHAVDQKRMDAMQREQAKKDAEAAAKAEKEAARQAEVDRKSADKLAREQAKQKAKADKQAAEAAKKKDDEAKRNGLDPKREVELLQERQRAIDAATAKLRASEAEYQAELAKRSSR